MRTFNFRAPEHLNRLRKLAFEQVTCPAIAISADLQIICNNKAALKLFPGLGSNKRLKFDTMCNGLINQQSLHELVQNCLGGLEIEEHFNLIFSERSYDGMLSLKPVKVGNKVRWVLLIFQDRTGFNRLKDRMTTDEFVDSESGLLSNRALDVMLEIAIEKAAKLGNGAKLALMMIQISNLEHLESLYSAEIMSAIFMQLTRTVRQTLPDNELIFRYDVNRIVLIVNSFQHKADLLILAEELENRIATPFSPIDMDVHLQSCIGITIFPEDGHNRPALLGNAAAALNFALTNGQPWLIFNDDIHSMAMEKLTMRSELSGAINRNELELRYMTLLDTEGRMRGLEALVRWRHPTRGLLAPDQFLPTAIHSKVMGAITRWVLFQVIDDWEQHFSRLGIFITFNLTASDLADLYLPDAIENAIRDRMPPSALKVEITESECMENYDQAMQAIYQYKARGIEVFIDDFGVGHSSLAYLKDLPASCAKIDKSFLDEVVRSPKELHFLGHIIAMCRLRGLQILLEGVESEQQYELLRLSGADLFQGHLFGAPMTVQDLLTRWAGVDIGSI